MLNFSNKCCWTVWKQIFHGRGTLCKYEISASTYKRGSARPFTNVFDFEDQVTGGRKNKKILGNVSDVGTGCMKENKDYVFLNNCPKCNFHSGLSHPNKNKNHKGYGRYQEPEKKEANILIAVCVCLVALTIYGNYLMDMSPYDKPAQKAEKL